MLIFQQLVTFLDKQHDTDVMCVEIRFNFVFTQQELMQKVYILKNELTPQEKAAMQDMKSSLQQAWVVRGI